MNNYEEEVRKQGIKWRAQLEMLDDNELMKFIRFTDRAEALENKRAYKKAIRATLYSLGYSSEFVNERLHDLLDDYYKFD